MTVFINAVSETITHTHIRAYLRHIKLSSGIPKDLHKQKLTKIKDKIQELFILTRTLYLKKACVRFFNFRKANI
jgi:hypothetical protein